MAAETQYTANTGMVTISTANSNLDGSGTLGTVLTAAAEGTLVKSVTIKATGNTTQGMVRLFISSGGTARIVAEVEVPAITKSATDPAFEVYIPANFVLKSGDLLRAATQNAESFNVLAEGLDWDYYASGVRPESTEYTAATVQGVASTANTNLDGTGTLATLVTGASNGTMIQSLTIKATGNTTPGMVRFFIYDGSSATKLLTEVEVPAVTKSATARSFSRRITFRSNGFALKSGYVLKASTQVGETFHITAECVDWAYPA